MAAFRLNGSGPPAVEHDGRPIWLEMRKTLALMIYLCFPPQPPLAKP